MGRSSNLQVGPDLYLNLRGCSIEVPGDAPRASVSTKIRTVMTEHLAGTGGFFDTMNEGLQRCQTVLHDGESTIARDRLLGGDRSLKTRRRIIITVRRSLSPGSLGDTSACRRGPSGVCTATRTLPKASAIYLSPKMAISPGTLSGISEGALPGADRPGHARTRIRPTQSGPRVSVVVAWNVARDRPR